MRVSEDDEMPAVLDCLEPTARDLADEDVTADEVFDITHLALDDAAVAGLGAGKYLGEPALGGEMIWKRRNGMPVPRLGKREINRYPRVRAPS